MQECQRCGAMLDGDEGICPTCGSVYGKATSFALPQLTPELLEKAKNNPELLEDPGAFAETVDGFVPEMIPPTQPDEPPAPMRAEPPQPDATQRAVSMPQPQGGEGFDTKTMILFAVVFFIMMVIGIVVGILALT